MGRQYTHLFLRAQGLFTFSFMTQKAWFQGLKGHRRIGKLGSPQSWGTEPQEALLRMHDNALWAGAWCHRWVCS